MLLEFTRPYLEAAEKIAAKGDVEATVESLRSLSLDDFGLLLLSMPNKQWPKLSKVLPAMASDDVQRKWTGACGTPLLQQSLDFVRAVRTEFVAATGRPLEGAKILDYGCGYGRLLRLMMRYAVLDNLVGCDPLEESIQICREDGIPCRLDVTDFLPESLPYPDETFDLMFAFSVFTHTSLRASKAALAALRKTAVPDALLAITIRPVEYWANDPAYTEEAPKLQKKHRKEGFVFVPHEREAVDGDITYGDTSMSLDYLASIAEGWKISGYDRSIFDENQIIVFLRPV